MSIKHVTVMITCIKNATQVTRSSGSVLYVIKRLHRCCASEQPYNKRKKITKIYKCKKITLEKSTQSKNKRKVFIGKSLSTVHVQTQQQLANKISHQIIPADAFRPYRLIHRDLFSLAGGLFVRSCTQRLG